MTNETEIPNARRNYALTAETFDCEHFLRISCADEALATVTQGIGKYVNFFLVFNEDGLDEFDADLDANMAVKRIEIHECVNEAWREAARFGYLHALSKLMVPDQRADRQLFPMSA